jgi:sortase A
LSQTHDAVQGSTTRFPIPSNPALLIGKAVAAGFLAFILLVVSLRSSTVNAGEAGPAIPTVMPVELQVPAAGIDASVQDVGVNDDGSMGVPNNFSDVAWFSPGYEPGEFGHAVFDGHVSNVDSAAVFFNVEDLFPGARIYVTGDDGTVLTFQVSDVESYILDGAPMQNIFGPSDWPEVVLITCGGGWHEDTHLFDHRTVVYAPLLDAPSP